MHTAFSSAETQIPAGIWDPSVGSGKDDLRSSLEAQEHRLQQALAANQLARYWDDPAGFAVEVLGLELTDEQRIGLTQLASGDLKVDCEANCWCGKLDVAAVAVAWWVVVRRSGSFIFVPTPRQKKSFWKRLKTLAVAHGGKFSRDWWFVSGEALSTIVVLNGKENLKHVSGIMISRPYLFLCIDSNGIKTDSMELVQSLAHGFEGGKLIDIKEAL